MNEGIGKELTGAQRAWVVAEALHGVTKSRPMAHAALGVMFDEDFQQAKAAVGKAWRGPAMSVGYARVSRAEDQKPQYQLDALTAAGLRRDIVPLAGPPDFLSQCAVEPVKDAEVAQTVAFRLAMKIRTVGHRKRE